MEPSAKQKLAPPGWLLLKACRPSPLMHQFGSELIHHMVSLYMIVSSPVEVGSALGMEPCIPAQMAPLWLGFVSLSMHSPTISVCDVPSVILAVDMLLFKKITPFSLMAVGKSLLRSVILPMTPR